jgi:hypothetical protein
MAADIGLVAGGVLLATGGVLLLVSTGKEHQAAGSLEVVPVVQSNVAGAVLGGKW